MWNFFVKIRNFFSRKPKSFSEKNNIRQFPIREKNKQKPHSPVYTFDDLLSAAPDHKTTNLSPPAPRNNIEYLKDLLNIIESLQRANEGWVKIFPAINAAHDPEANALLLKMRGPHMFRPHVCLNLLEINGT